VYYAYPSTSPDISVVPLAATEVVVIARRNYPRIGRTFDLETLGQLGYVGLTALARHIGALVDEKESNVTPFARPAGGSQGKLAVAHRRITNRAVWLLDYVTYRPQSPPPHICEDQQSKASPSMLASFPASMVNQKSTDLGIPNRFKLKSSRFRRKGLSSNEPKWERQSRREVPILGLSVALSKIPIRSQTRRKSTKPRSLSLDRSESGLRSIVTADALFGGSVAGSHSSLLINHSRSPHHFPKIIAPKVRSNHPAHHQIS
jgi:hypothetical protein